MKLGPAGPYQDYFTKTRNEAPLGRPRRVPAGHQPNRRRRPRAAARGGDGPRGYLEPRRRRAHLELHPRGRAELLGPRARPGPVDVCPVGPEQRAALLDALAPDQPITGTTRDARVHDLRRRGEGDLRRARPRAGGSGRRGACSRRGSGITRRSACACSRSSRPPCRRRSRRSASAPTSTRSGPSRGRRSSPTRTSSARRRRPSPRGSELGARPAGVLVGRLSTLRAHGSGPLVVNEVGLPTATEPGYVELHNRGDTDLDLSRVHVTDDLRFPAKYALPDGTVIPRAGTSCSSQTGRPGPPRPSSLASEGAAGSGGPSPPVPRLELRRRARPAPAGRGACPERSRLLRPARAGERLRPRERRRGGMADVARTPGPRTARRAGGTGRGRASRRPRRRRR